MFIIDAKLPCFNAFRGAACLAPLFGRAPLSGRAPLFPAFCSSSLSFLAGHREKSKSHLSRCISDCLFSKKSPIEIRLSHALLPFFFVVRIVLPCFHI